jgi:hypothetical protein
MRRVRLPSKTRCDIRIHVAAPPPSAPTPVPPVSADGNQPAWVGRLVGGLLAVSEALPFVDNDSNGLVHSVVRRIRDPPPSQKE